MTDEGLREIQLDGKQLVFLFMAATVVAVVIFLCGVMVGRGVPVRAGAVADAQEQADLDPTAASQSALTQVVATDGDAPVAAGEDLSYDGLLRSTTSPEETLRPPSETAATPPAPRPDAASFRPVETPTPAPAGPRVASSPRAPAPLPASPARTLDEPRGNGYVVQVAAVPRRAEANTIARRLSGKGYPAFVTTSGSNFRVRVGKYPNRREAETVASRLEREERVDSWVTR
jgi:cell division septation protein DedD